MRELHVLWTAVRRKTPTGGRVDQVVQRVGTTVGNHVVTLTVQRLIDLELIARQPVTVLGVQVRSQLRRTAAGEAAWQHFRRDLQAVTPSTSSTVMLLAAQGQAGSINKTLRSQGMDGTGFATFDSSGCFDSSGGDCGDCGDGDGGDAGGGGGGGGGH